ncbi:MAG TPA: class I mannose-6-phosphate isomerase [Bryobacteraceae bacterium]|nr:class I mannose-6-phosphate isomerase [Bryobacteraceae bacterium]
MPQTPARLSDEMKEKIWGSLHLEPWYESGGRRIGEVWFTRPDPLPLLVKLIFTEADLSVQVHPDDAFAAVHDHSLGKTEMWHILRASPGAKLALGFREQITHDRLRETSQSGEIMDLLKWVVVHPGDTFFIPAGTVHAIGAGIVLCEVQQQSDVTYRLYDYGRPRPLHLDKGVAVSNTGSHPGCAPRTALSDGGELLVECPYFRTELHTFSQPIQHRPNGHSEEIIVFLRGTGVIGGRPFRLGDAWLVSGVDRVTVEPDGEVSMLRTFVPAAVS